MAREGQTLLHRVLLPGSALCLPCFTVLVALQRGGDVPAISNLFIVLCFLVLLTDWRNTLVMLLAGTGIAAAVYAAITPDPEAPHGPGRTAAGLCTHRRSAEISSRFPPSRSTPTANCAQSPCRIHCPRNAQPARPDQAQPGGHAASPAATDDHATGPDLGGAQVDTLYRHLAESEMAVRRGLQVIAMTLDEVSAKPVDTSAFSYLSAAATPRRRSMNTHSQATPNAAGSACT